MAKRETPGWVKNILQPYMERYWRLAQQIEANPDDLQAKTKRVSLVTEATHKVTCGELRELGAPDPLIK